MTGPRLCGFKTHGVDDRANAARNKNAVERNRPGILDRNRTNVIHQTHPGVLTLTEDRQPRAPADSGGMA